MIVSKTAQIHWNGFNREYYEIKGYTFTKYNDLFEVKVNDLLSSTHAKIVVQCETCGETRQLSYSDSHKTKNTGHKCVKCIANSRRGIDENRRKKIESFLSHCKREIDADFLTKYWDTKNTVDPDKLICSDKWSKIWIRCQDDNRHGCFQTTPHKYSMSTHTCPFCMHRRFHILDSLASLHPDVVAIWGDNNRKSPYEYSPSNAAYVWWKCPAGVHSEYKRTINNANKCSFRCPMCVQEEEDSQYQVKVNMALEESGYTILHELDCTIAPLSPKSGRKLRFDNEIKELSLLCEVHGEQHYSSRGNFHARSRYSNSEESFQEQQWRDKYKRDYAISHGYRYIEIPYWTVKDGSYICIIQDAISAAEKAVAI
jgi:hypothetical protein